jgi:hypothetical protein
VGSVLFSIFPRMQIRKHPSGTIRCIRHQGIPALAAVRIIQLSSCADFTALSFGGA